MSPWRWCLILVALLDLGCGGAGGGGAAPAGGGVRAGGPGATRVTLLQTTDLHGHARDAGTPEAGGYARIAAYVEAVRASAGHPVLLVDSGDWSMGTLYDLTLARCPLPLWFADALRYDCLTLGNHEFDYTPAGLAAILAAARNGFGLRTPLVASNLDLGGDAHLAPLVGPGRAIRPTRVQTLANGVRVGYLGLMGRDAARDAASAPVRFIDYARDYAQVQGLVDDLRGPRGCALVVALSHAGTEGDGGAGEDVDLARNVTGIDVIASGHTHNSLAAARSVANGAWRTLIGCAGAFGAGVFRMDLALRPGGGVDLEGSENRAMTGAGLAGLGPPAPADPAFGVVVAGVDRSLNRELGDLLAQLPGFGPDAGLDPARGIHRPVATCAADLRGPGRGAGPGPDGLGNLCADALRAVPNALLAGAREAGADATPFSAAALAAGELRGALEAGGPVTFADVFGLLPLGLSPDPDPGGITGEPLVSGYLDPEGCRTLCALQLLAQTGLVTGDFYLNLSGLVYALEPAGEAAFFTAAAAAAALEATRRRAREGSPPAALALAAVGALPGDRGAALRAAMAEGNRFARALVKLADPAPDAGRVAANLEALGQVAAVATADGAGAEGAGLASLLMAKALAAIGPVSAFAPGDPACTGPAAPLGSGRIRVALDLYLVLMMDRAQALLGTRAALYRAAQGDAVLSAAAPGGLEAILANRILLAPDGPLRELKAWLAVLLYLTTPPARGGHFQDGRITAEYAAPADFRRFPEAGAAVRVRNAAYPLARLAALADLVQALLAA